MGECSSLKQLILVRIFDWYDVTFEGCILMMVNKYSGVTIVNLMKSCGQTLTKFILRYLMSNLTKRTSAGLDNRPKKLTLSAALMILNRLDVHHWFHPSMFKNVAAIRTKHIQCSWLLVSLLSVLLVEAMLDSFQSCQNIRLLNNTSRIFNVWNEPDRS